MLLWSLPVLGFPLPCGGQADQPDIAAALTRIRHSIDPCGESPQVVALLEKLERCTATSYQICTNRRSERNSFDRPLDEPTFVRTITWNPALLTAIEFGCDGDPTKPVLRDATASLLHELVHAAQDCDGLDPDAHEFEAVRMENVYRRAAGMCQRTKYGDDPLPLEMIRLCDPAHCLCTFPVDDNDHRVVTAPSRRPDASSVDAIRSGDARPADIAP